MVFPIFDDDSSLRGRRHYVTLVLIGLCLLVYGLQVLDPPFTYGYSVVPLEISTGEDLIGTERTRIGDEVVQIPQEPGPGNGAGSPFIYLTILSAMFMHGGLGHLGGNLLYLWIFGDNVENRFGARAFLLFYLVSGIVATLAQILVDPYSVIPNLGASGAIAGVLGAYLVLFPQNRVYSLFFYLVVPIPALLAIGLWFGMQIVGGFGQLNGAADNIAYAAHLGGFACGVVLGLLHRVFMRQEPPNGYAARYARDPRTVSLWAKDAGRKRWF